jgi:hypothetical protein
MSRRLNVNLSRQTVVDLRQMLYRQAYDGPPSTTVYKRQRQLRDLAIVDEALAGGPIAKAAEAELAERAARSQGRWPPARTITHG